MPDPFRPAGATVNIDVSSSTQPVEIGPCDSIRIMNDGTATVWVRFGGSSVTSSLTTGMPIGPGVTEVIGFEQGLGQPITVAAIAAGSTGKIYFTPGIGI